MSISILDFKLFPEDPEFYSCFHLREDTRHTLYTDKMEFHILELPKLPKELQEDSSALLLWAKFINAEQKEEFDMLAEKNPYIESAYEQLQVISQDKAKRLEYEAREKAILDYNQMIYEAQAQGLAQGLEQGLEQGHKQGHEEGLEEGRKEGIAALILDNLEEGFSKEKILAKLEQRFFLTKEQAEGYLQEFSK